MSQRKFTPESKERQAQAGRANLKSWHQRAQEARRDTNAALAEFEAQLMAELGANPSATRRAIAQSIISNYGAILLLNKELHKQRGVNIMSVAERSSWLSAAMLRALKTLNLDAKSRPRTLADILAAKVEPTGHVAPPEPPISA